MAFLMSFVAVASVAVIIAALIVLAATTTGLE